MAVLFSNEVGVTGATEAVEAQRGIVGVSLRRRSAQRMRRECESGNRATQQIVSMNSGETKSVNTMAKEKEVFKFSVRTRKSSRCM